MKSKHKTKNAFTLVELLVVISIIALLLSVLLPALSRARDQARRVVCFSNGRSIGIACTAFALQNNEWLPMYDGRMLSGGQLKYLNIYPHRKFWYHEIAPFMDYANTDYNGFFTATGNDPPKTARDAGISAPKSISCPSVPVTESKGTTVLGFGWNWNTGGYCFKSDEDRYNAATIRRWLPRKLSSVKNAGTAALLGENRWDSLGRFSYAWGGVAILASGSTPPQYYYGKRHFNGGTYICVDGHAEYGKYAELAKDYAGANWATVSTGVGPRIIYEILPKR